MRSEEEVLRICRGLNEEIEKYLIKYHEKVPTPKADVEGLIIIRFAKDQTKAVTMMGNIEVGSAIAIMMDTYVDDQIKRRGAKIPVA